MPVINCFRSALSTSPCRPLLAAALACNLGLSLPATAEEPETPDNFGECVANLQERAISEGVSEETASNVMSQVAFQPRVIELDRRQPEFTTTFASYLNLRVTDQRVEKGRELLREHEDLLARVTQETGVPAPYLVSFWGLETNYGSYFGKMSVPSSLTTLACDERRGAYFSRELMAALQIIDEGAIEADKMEGSWAGAMGHVQFMPSVFLRFAQDGDNDGKRDLWNSVDDAMFSAGTFLESMNWDSDYRWGREVLLPEDFDYAVTGEGRKPLSEWAAMGITDTSGNALPEEDIDAALIVPTGHRGPAFLAYRNFRVIMGWNQSEYYAIAVGHLADRIAGGGELHTPPPEDVPALSRDNVQSLQRTLSEQGYDTGKPDGIMGPATRSAIRAYQADNDLIADGFPGPDLLQQLGIVVTTRS